MAQFKFIGHSNGACPDHDVSKSVRVQSPCAIGSSEHIDLLVAPGEVFEISDAHPHCIEGIVASSRKGFPLYERVA